MSEMTGEFIPEQGERPEDLDEPLEFANPDDFPDGVDD